MPKATRSTTGAKAAAKMNMNAREATKPYKTKLAAKNSKKNVSTSKRDKVNGI